ncbi:PP2C family protein-serine/threonine phosphatase [Mycobacterium paraterrae]|uniref:Serine/threonine-protein phosphatase n=1 Tax=Mycobacterium paraterrae TaxID=577492 RepID=A0ABY3VKG3_9MYCO|nr:PP2C family protein-serine/threonine phosphatase [Mycobacterium paraterrae]UMB69131.1 serine/threonine-protein phosphatase [Mycobacterium paraterrae]
MLDPAPATADTGHESLWTYVACPTLVVDQTGAIRALSASAQELLPSAALGSQLEATVDWLSPVHMRLVAPSSVPTSRESFNAGGPVGGRKFEAHHATLPSGEVAWSLVEDTGHVLREAQYALTREHERAAFLLEASSVLMASLNIDRCREATVLLAARDLADAAVVVAPAGRGRRMPIFYCDHNGTVEQRSVDADPASVTGLSEALRGFPPVPSRWIDAATLPDWLIPTGFPAPVRSVMITPLPGHGVSAGALVLLRHAEEGEFSEGEEVLARLFAARAGAALSAARLYAEQAAITRTLMRDLLPPDLHPVHGIEFAGAYRASEDYEVVGGDFYDVHPAPTPDGETLVVLGDVCGKGLEAAMLTGKIRNTLQALTPLAADHHAVLELLNGAMLSTEHARFTTLVLASVANRDGSVVVRLTSAGHLPPLIIREGGRVEQADTFGTLIGALPEIHAQSFETTLAPGETCVLYTDGVTEARGGPLGDYMFGEERLAAALAECGGMPATAVVERVMMLATQWVGQQVHDDIAVVAITAPRRTHLSAVDGHTRGRFTA